MVIALTVVVAGCGTSPSATGTAKGGLEAARSALSTVAPDAKLLVTQTQSMSGTATPVWGYLFGSPSTDMTYVVYVEKGKAVGAQEYGAANLGDEWSSVPGIEDWKVDSDVALQKASEASGVKNPTAYTLGLMTYVPKSQEASPTTKVFVWYVQLQSADASASVYVDAKTGKASLK